MLLTEAVEERRLHRRRVTLEVGCGSSKRSADSIGVDRLPLPGVDVVGDVDAALSTLTSETVDSIHSYHFWEHLADLEGHLAICSRVLRTGGVMKATVPHFSNPFYYSDPTHKSPMGLYTPSYFCAQSFLRRKVPTYGNQLPFRYDNCEFVFRSESPRFGRTAWKKKGQLVNLSTFTKEWYEEMLAWRLPCYEIRFTLVRL
jgi:SAM-dependent methyltransferase